MIPSSPPRRSSRSRKATIGYVGTYQMSFALLDSIKRTFPNARYVDASDMVDRIKVIKSAEEMELVKRAALMQDGAMRAAFAAVKPGMRDTEVAAIAQHYSRSWQRERHLSLRLDAARHAGEIRPTALQNRIIQKGDQIALLVEDNGPGRHVHRARPLLRRRRQGAAGDEGRARVLQGSRASSRSTCSSPARPARTSGTLSTTSCARTAGPRRRGSIAMARATIWSSAR